VGGEWEPSDALPCQSRRTTVPPNRCTTSTGRLEAEGRAFLHPIVTAVPLRSPRTPRHPRPFAAPSYRVGTAAEFCMPRSSGGSRNGPRGTK
jgi:hypothetical protein